MLEFWFDPKVSIGKKLLFLIFIAAASIALYWYQPLTLDNILLFAGSGIIFLICRYCKVHFAAKNPTGLLYRLLTWIPIAILLALIFKNMNNGEILLPGAQGIAFMALAVCIFSPLSLMNRNTSE
ncbi:AzlD domain-containing protein [Acinetobacter sp. P8-3-8]|uniref:AzlD domain-containing protein n=1 Tax=Acinetobacter sp. P8-3-8 TaxID=1029823 RepID=UPI000248803D|nr:AzlD domain-containing protein [Acinetobacter sp. P8-3-8]